MRPLLPNEGNGVMKAVCCMALTVICYDITDDHRRNKVAKLLLDYGERVQYSVFECTVSEDMLKQAMEKIVRIIDTAKDSVRCYRLCERCTRKIAVNGITKKYSIDDDFIII